jgi:hypothetical protein
MKQNTILFLFLILPFMSSGQFAGHVKVIQLSPNGTVSANGNISEGEIISDLSWASRSSVACFPATQNSKFRGKHQLFAFELPSYSEVTIKLIPENSNENMSLYAYQIGKTNYPLPPNLSSCVSCEASHKWDRPKRGKTQDHTRSVKLNAIRNSYNVVVGVTGSVNVKGKFRLEIYLKTRETIAYDSKPAKVYTLKAEKGKALSYKGNISEGKTIPLEWASTSNMACFPATRNGEFRGNHLFYRVEIPKYSKMKVTVIPKNGKRINLYAISGYDGTSLPPNISRCVTCEAGYAKYIGNTDLTKSAGEQSIELMAINNSYNVLIGVAGAKGTTNGEFIIKVELMDK